MYASRYKPLIIVSLLLFAVGFAVLRWWQGPKLAGYVVASTPLVQTVVATGRVVTVSRAQVGSEITGVVLERHVKEGDQVAPGDVLLVLRADDIAAQVRQAEAALMELTTSTRPQAAVAMNNAETQLAQANRELARRRDLTQRALLPAEALEQAEQAQRLASNAYETARLNAAALAGNGVEEQQAQQRLAALQAQLAKTIVRSQVAGTVLTRNAEPGDLVQPGKVLFTIALAGHTEILVPLDERNLSRLALQQPAFAIADAYPNQPFAAHVNFIAPSIDPQRGTVDVRLSVVPEPAFLRQDMTVSVNIETGRREQALTIANDALSAVQADHAQVLLVRSGKIQRQTVGLGLRGLVRTEVLTGLHAGDQVLADAASTLEEGTRVRFVEQNMLPNSGTNSANTRNELPVKLN